MAGDWIKVRTDLHEDPAVIEIATRLGVRTDTVVGYCVRFWSFVSRQCHDGSVTGVTLKALGDVLTLPGFPELLVDVGWLEYDESGPRPVILIPKFERHLSQSSKSRVLAAERQRNARHANVTKMSRCERDTSVTREDKRREENTKIQKGKNGAGKGQDFDQFWQAYPKRNGKRLGRARTEKIWRQLQPGDQAAAIEAAGHYASSKVARDNFAKDPERFLRDRLWLDWLDGPGDSGDPPPVKRQPTAAEQAEALRFQVVRQGRGRGWSEDQIEAAWLKELAARGLPLPDQAEAG